LSCHLREESKRKTWLKHFLGATLEQADREPAQVIHEGPPRCNIAIRGELTLTVPHFLPRLTFQALAVLFWAAPPGIAPSQNPPANNKPEGTVRTQMRNAQVFDLLDGESAAFFPGGGRAAGVVSVLLAVDPLEQDMEQKVTARNAKRQEDRKRHRNLTGLARTGSADVGKAGAERLKNPERGLSGIF
jgi:hypothetical protein